MGRKIIWGILGLFTFSSAATTQETKENNVVEVAVPSQLALARAQFDSLRERKKNQEWKWLAELSNTQSRNFNLGQNQYIASEIPRLSIMAQGPEFSIWKVFD